MSEPPDRWDRLLAFHRSRTSLVLLCLVLVFVAFSDNSAWTIPLKILVLVQVASYGIAVGVKSAQGFKAGYRDPR
ncbi:MAG TPA: hypothetical protein VHO29_06545 [Marmoricola sp.]|nr:hypothetical protein [Marmoricola sp.]